MKLFFFSLFCLISLSAESYYGNRPDERIVADILCHHPSVSLEEVLTVTVRFRYPEPYSFAGPSSPKEGESALKLSEKTVSDPLFENHIFVQEMTFSYEPLWEGEHICLLPPLHFRDVEGKLFTLYPPLLEVSVSSLPREENRDAVASLLPLRGEEPVELTRANKESFRKTRFVPGQSFRDPFLKSTIGPFLWKGLLIGGAFFTVFLLYRKKRFFFTKRIFFRKEVNPVERALEALRHLQKGLSSLESFAPFYVEITRIVRHFIERFYHIKAEEQTTEEFLRIAMKEKLFKESVKHSLAEFLNFADLVKFAGHHPRPDDCHRAYEAAYTFISESDKG